MRNPIDEAFKIFILQKNVFIENDLLQYLTILAGDQSRRLVNTMKILPCELPTVVEGIAQMDYQVVPSDRYVL